MLLTMAKRHQKWLLVKVQFLLTFRSAALRDVDRPEVLGARARVSVVGKRLWH